MLASRHSGTEERLKILFNHTSCHLLVHLLLTAIADPLLISQEYEINNAGKDEGRSSISKRK